MAKVLDNIVGFGAQIVKALTQGAMKTANPDNVSSQIGRTDLDPKVQEELEKYLTGDAKFDAQKLIRQGEEWFEEAREGRWEHHGDSFTNLAFYAGKHYHYWNQEADGGNGMMQPIPAASGNSDFDEMFLHKYENVFATMIDRAVARIAAVYPDAWGAPLTDSDKDKLAAQVLRAINGHCSRITKRDRLLRDAVLNMLLTTTVFIECGWDPKAAADLGIPNPDGSIHYAKAPIGDVKNVLLLGFDCYPDPNAATTGEGIHGGAYFIKRHIMNVQDIADKWGIPVTATDVSVTYGYLRQRLEYIAGDHSRLLSRIKNCTEVTEVWNKPCKQFPRGRYWVYSADKTLLWAGYWPYKKKDKYPFVDLGFKENTGSVWSLNMGNNLVPLQRTLNRLATYLAGRLEWDRPTAWIDESAEVKPNDLLNPAYGKVVTYKGLQSGGAQEPIKWNYPPPVGEFYFQYEKSLLAKMELIAGVHDFNADTANAPNSGFEFELRMQTDKEILAPAIKRVCEAVVELYEWDGALYEQFGASFPRLLGLSDKAIPAKDLMNGAAAATALVDINALKEGNCRVVLQPGSGEAKLPAAQEEDLRELVKLLEGAPPPLVEFFLNQSNAIRSDAEIDRLIDGLKQYEQDQAQSALNVQQMKGDQAQQQLQLKDQIAQSQANAQTQAEQAKAAVDVHAQSLIETWRMQADIAVEQARFQHQMAILQAKGSTPSVSLTGDLGPVGIASAEQAANLSPDDIATLKNLLTKKSNPAAAGGQKGQSYAKAA